jgi:hypoxanthine phosphoribosyltransferase
MKGEKTLEGNKREKVLFSRDEISARIKDLGKELSESYQGKNLVVVSLLRGSFIFAADLVREISVPLEIDFITTASYGNNEVTSGVVEIVHDLRAKVEGKDVLIVDDIIDSGFTLKKVIEHINDKNPNSVKVCVLLDKPSRRQVDLTPDYSGFTIPDVFIVGYGLNYGDHYRNIPYIFTFE